MVEVLWLSISKSSRYFFLLNRNLSFIRNAIKIPTMSWWFDEMWNFIISLKVFNKLKVVPITFDNSAIKCDVRYKKCSTSPYTCIVIQIPNNTNILIVNILYSILYSLNRKLYTHVMNEFINQLGSSASGLFNFIDSRKFMHAGPLPNFNVKNTAYDNQWN